MMKGLLIVERFVLESLNKSAKTTKELEEDTGLQRQIVLNILSSLRMKNIVFKNDFKYCLNFSQKEKWIHLINDKEQQMMELKELFTTLVNSYFEEEQGKQNHSKMKLKKVSLQSLDESIINNYFQKIEDYLNSISENSFQKNSQTKEQKVFLWGSSDYGKLMNNFIQFG